MTDHDNIEVLLAGADTDKRKADVLNEYALILRKKDPVSMVRVAALALTFAEKSKEHTVIADSHRICGIAYSHLSSYNESRRHFTTALRNYQYTGDQKACALVNSNLGALYQQMGQYNTALEHLLQSLAIYQSIGDNDGLAGNLINVANIYSMMNDYANGLEYCRQALVLTEKTGNREMNSKALGNIGIVLVKQGLYDEAINYHMQALLIKKEIGNLVGIPTELVNLGCAYSQKEDFDSALEYFQQALSICSELSDERSTAVILVNISEIHRKTLDISTATILIEQAISKCVRLNASELLYAAHYEAAQIYELAADYYKAYLHYTKYSILKDEVLNQERQRALTALQVQYDMERSLKQQEELRRKLLEVEQNALQSQINPHFLSNALYSIQGFITDGNKEAANRYLSKFAKLIRMTLEQVKKRFISLQEEVEILTLYLELEKLRFTRKFEYVIDVDSDLAMQDFVIPPMLLQPYIENAIKHGILPNTNPVAGCIHITIRRLDEEYMECLIQDNGIGRIESQKRKSTNGLTKHTSLGMNITHERLELLEKSFDKKFRVHIVDLVSNTHEASGTKIILTMPLLHEFTVTHSLNIL